MKLDHLSRDFLESEYLRMCDTVEKCYENAIELKNENLRVWKLHYYLERELIAAKEKNLEICKSLLDQYKSNCQAFRNCDIICKRNS